MNADGNDLPVEERRKLREQAAAQRAAEIRAGLLQTRAEMFSRRKALAEALDDGTAGEKLKAALKKLAAERQPARQRYIPVRGRRPWPE